MAFKLNATVFGSEVGEWKYQSEGTLRKICKGLTLTFTKKNLAKIVNSEGKYNRVNIIATDKKDNQFNVPCSEPLSKQIRNVLKTHDRNTVMATLLDFEIQSEIEKPEKYFLMNPQGEKLEGMLVEDLAKMEGIPMEELLSVL